MKAIKQLLVITGSALIIASCQNNSDQQKIESEPDQAVDRTADNNDMNNASSQKYVDLKTGQPADLYYDNDKKMTYSAVTNEPVDLYVNVATGDTIYGQGRYVVNNYVVKTNDGTYKLDDSKVKVSKDGLKIKDGNRKLKIEDGEMKIKDGDNKMKSSDDKEKVKGDDYKQKADNDEEKMKTDDQKTKTDNGETKTKDSNK